MQPAEARGLLGQALNTFITVPTTLILDETEGIVNIGIAWDIVVWEVSK